MSGQLRIVVSPSVRGRLLHPFKFNQLFDSAVRESAEEAELIFGSYAARHHGNSAYHNPRTGQLQRGIRTIVLGGSVMVVAEAKNPDSGFDYVGVTRFGHRKLWIYPRGDRGEATVLSAGVNPVTGKANKMRATDGQAALRIPTAGGPIFRRRVRGFRPATDWAEDALPEIRRNTEVIMGRLARKVEAAS